MDLKQYIYEVISQIAEATKEINGGVAETKLLINPSLKEIRNLDAVKYAVYRDPDDDSFVHLTQLIDVEFDVAITSETKTETGGKLGISVLGFGAATGENSITANHVKFTMPVLFPSIKLDNYPCKD